MNDAAASQVIVLSCQHACAIIRAHEEELGKLDAAAGDGDHGAAMMRGVHAARTAVESSPDAASAALLETAGAAFADEAGGASGALYGAWIGAIGAALGDGPYAAPQVVAALQVSLATLSALGKAKPGDKTMIDALAPFVAALDHAVAAGQTLAAAWQTALPAAQAGADSTADMVARRGRSARLGERSLGHRDPGAVSMTYLLQAAGAALAEQDA